MDHYNKQDGLKYELQCRCNGIVPFEGSRKEFPDNCDQFLEKFFSIEKKMNEEWHQNVNWGAAVAGDGRLTDHGIKHIQSVIQHAYEILTDVQQLTGYEIFILLISIHFHDVGNIYGREAHEQKIAEIIESMSNELPLSTPEKQFINDIATAHGGYYDGDKDTIRHICSDVKYGNVLFRPKVLAAILRFADEISDDLGRSNFKGDIPPKSEVFHEYSKALSPISIDGETISLHFRIPYNLTQEKIGKGEKKVYLYDEILERMAKCMRELEYCKKFANGLIRPTALSVKIDILQKDSFRPIKGNGDSFRLSLQGYPSEQLFSLESYMEKHDDTVGIAKELRYKNGKELSRLMKGTT